MILTRLNFIAGCRRIPISIVFVVGSLVLVLTSFILLLVTVRSSKAPDVTPDGQHAARPHAKLLETKQHRLAVVVPFRDRYEALSEFVPHMWSFLSHQNVAFELFVINQNDALRFNRASLINVGFQLAVQRGGDCDYMAMHDVDLMPVNDNISYAYEACKHAPFHIAAPDLHPLYHYEKFVGGILMVTREQFEQVNGMSNNYYGWGWEDDEFYVRLKRAGYVVSRPLNIGSNFTNTFKHAHDRRQHRRDSARYYDQALRTKRLDQSSGLSNVAYRIIQTRKLYVDSITGQLSNNSALISSPWCWFVDIELICDLHDTPWCIPPAAVKADAS